LLNEAGSSSYYYQLRGRGSSYMSGKGRTRHGTAEYIRAEQQRLSAIPTHLREREVSPYKRFLELPVPIVLVVGWLAGVALIGLCASVLLLLWLLLGVAAGS
jgi:hypothetical protein